MSSSVERLGGGTEEPMFFQAFNHDDGEVYQGPQHNSRISSASSPPFICHVNSSLHNLSPCSSALCARNPNYSTLSNPIQQQQAFSLTLSHPRPKTSAVAVTLGPFAGFLTTLNWSRFLDAARQLLEEMSDFTRGVGLATDRGAREALSIDSELVVGFVRGSPEEVCAEERQLTKARLISMINEVCTKYMLYFQQVQAVIESFRLVAGLGNASPCISMALKSMSKHFKNVKNMITHQLERINKALGKQSFNKTETCGFGFANVEHGNTGGHGLSVRAQSHIWRSQRGLPERAVAVLRAWLFEHFLHPYPTDLDKQVLARQTGLTRNQVSNWFINARVRIWKPMVEEMHNMEMPQVRGAVVAAMSQLIDKQASQPSSSIATSSSKQPPKNGCILMEQKSCCQHLSSEIFYIPHPAEEPCSIVSYHDFPGKGNAVVFDNGGSGTGVSLTLGLKGNAGVSFPERLLPSSSLFGFEECGDAYAFEGQDRSLVKDVDGHPRRHFVG